MAERVVWQSRRSRHERRYAAVARFPYVVRWGNPNLTLPAMRRTYVGASITATLWHLMGRRHIQIVKR